MRFLIAYDIADPARLRRVARFLEKRALRCQKSVFHFRGDATVLTKLLDELTPLLAKRARKMLCRRGSSARDQPPRGLVRGSPAVVEPAAAVLLPGKHHLIVEKKL